MSTSRPRASAKETAPRTAPAEHSGGMRRRWRGFKALLSELYEGHSGRAVRFRYAMLAFDLVMITFVVVSSFFTGALAIEILDAIFGVVILADVSARLLISRSAFGELLHPFGIADLIVVVSLLAPLAGENLAFLRVLRALRLFRSYQLVRRLRQDFPFFRRNRDVVFSTVNLFVFLFVMTALVFETHGRRNPEIGNYADALYFTVTTLTTTGFGDITLQGTSGRLLAVLIMIFGVSLFIRLAQTIFRPTKVDYVCPSCGLSRHDPDAVHCKHCGEVINIPTEGAT